MEIDTLFKKNPFKDFLLDEDSHALFPGQPVYSVHAKYYKQAGDQLVESALNDSSLLDVNCLPACYLYRHAIELFIKDLLWKLRWLDTNQKGLPETDHNLESLWNLLEAHMNSLYARIPFDRPLSKTDLGYIRKLIRIFHGYDDQSFSFRYPYQRKGGRTLVGTLSVDLKILGVQMSEVFDRLNYLLDEIEHLLDCKMYEERC
jgi:hypothetical protein